MMKHIPACRDGTAPAMLADDSAACASAARAQPHADNVAEPQQSPGGQVSESLQTGTPVAVLRATWPRYACKEMAGKAWHATVVARTAGAAKVRFTNNCARDGRRYEDVCLPLGALRLIA